jgi:hypothetical protein
MADTFTANLKLHLPQLGKKPWKSDWDFNFTKLDQIIGGLTIDGSVCAKCAETIHGDALVPFIQSATGDLSGASAIPAGETHEVRIDHSSDIVFDFPLEPIFTAPGNVNCVLLADRNALDATEYGGVFVIRVENHSDSTVNAGDVSWLRKGLKLS